MKKFDTEYISNKKADLKEITDIIRNLFTENTEEWVSIFDTSKKNPNYIQVHYDIEILDDTTPVIKFIESVLNYDASAIDEKDFYLIEHRKYENEKNFKHYRAFFDKTESIISYIEQYMNDEEINVKNWIDVTEEFDNTKENTNGANDMEKMNHEFFKELDLVNGIKSEIDFDDDTIILWEENINGINTTLWYEKGTEISSNLLDVFTKFLNNFAEYNQKAVKALENYLTEDNEYIVFHIDEVELDLPKDTTKFVECMNTTNIGLWIGEENIVNVDYMIAPEETDEILSVKFDSNLQIIDIAWES